MFAIAEAVETAEASEWVCSTGVDCQQGYYFGVPTVHPPWIQKNRQKSKKLPNSCWDSLGVAALQHLGY